MPLKVPISWISIPQLTRLQEMCYIACASKLKCSNTAGLGDAQMIIGNLGTALGRSAWRMRLHLDLLVC